MKYLCGGPYPSTYQQAIVLREEPLAPNFSLEHYITTVEAVNEYLLFLMVQHIRTRFQMREEGDGL